jgi:alcohol dehydrogenase (cytochrome c)
MNSSVRSLSAIVLCSVSILLSACATTTPTSAPASSPPMTATAATWPMYNGTYSGDRWRSLSQINTSNVKNLKIACTFPTGEIGAFQSGPVISHGTIYFTTVNTTYGINATSCKLKWKSVYHPSVQIFNTNRGVALDNGKLYRGTQDGHLLSLDAATGKVLWNVNVADPKQGYFLSAAPIVWNGMVFTGVAGADWGARGRMMAFDASDGHQLWRFDLIPMDGEAGANTWGKASTAATGGGSSWTTYSLDPQTGELFVPVGNPSPDFSGDYRPGANLYTDSLVVLDAASGTLKWYYQAVPHDTHDYDVAAAPILITTANSKSLAVFAGKNGYLYALDRSSHALIYKVPITTVMNSTKPPTVQGVRVCPGWVGGVEWNGPAYDQTDNTVIVGANDWCGKYVLGEARYVAGSFFLGGSFVGDPYTAAHGWVTSVDADTGKVRWRDKTTGPALAAVTPTAGGVVFTGDLAGVFYALDEKTGKVLYTDKTSGALAGGVVAYQIHGKEYIAVDSGNVSRSVWPGASGSATMYVFSL